MPMPTPLPSPPLLLPPMPLGPLLSMPLGPLPMAGPAGGATTDSTDDSQQLSITPPDDGQQSPLSPRVAHVGWALHAAALDGG